MMKNTSLMMLISISLPSKLLRTAMAGSSTIMRMATKSCMISTTSTMSANFCFFMPMSLNALMTMVVEDMASIPPRKMLSVVVQPKR